MLPSVPKLLGELSRKVVPEASFQDSDLAVLGYIFAMCFR